MVGDDGPVTPALGKLRWEDLKFEDSLDYIARSLTPNLK
jgi:hypothetical protein